MTTTAELIARVRLELADLPETFSQNTVGDGTSTTAKLNYYPVDPTSIIIKIDGTPLASNAFTVDDRTGRIDFTTAPDADSSIEVTGRHFRYFSDSDITEFISDAAAQQMNSRTDAFGRRISVANLPAVEVYPLSLLATIQALYALATDAAFDIDISAPDGVSIPRSERYRQLMDMISMLQERYKELSQALGIGIYAVEVFTARRVSKATGRLVPVYVAQEIEDRMPAQRVYLPIPTGGGEVIPSTVSIYDIITRQGDSYSATLDFGFDLTGYAVTAQARTYPQNPISTTFTVTVVDAAAGTITITLTPAQTRRLPIRSVWDCQVANLLDTNDVKTFLEGSVFCSREVTI